MTRTDSTFTRRLVAVGMSVSLVLPSSMVVPVDAQGTTTPPTSTPTTQTTPATPPAPAKPAPVETPDGTWPRNYTTEKGDRFVVHQPQVASWDDQKKMTAFAAVAFVDKDNAPSEKPALGTIKIEADTKVSTEERLVDFSSFRLLETNFPTLDRDKIQHVAKSITEHFPKEQRVLALDRVLQSVDLSRIIPRNIEGVKADPPTVFFSKRPAVLINLDGEPIWNEVPGTDLKFAVNTNWDLFELTPTKTYYFRNDKTWLKAAAVTGPWEPAGTLPPSFKKFPTVAKDSTAEDNFKDAREAVPGKKLSAKDAPTVFVSMTPAELILLKGEPKYEEVEGTALLWVSNTEADVFRAGPTGLIYYLVAGRWFSAADFVGPWTFASLSLPPDFLKIPLEHDRSRVLASVPGSTQAAEAVLLASIPQTARVNKRTIKAPEVTYSGEPKFEPIEKTSVSRAVNTEKDIIKVGDAYYMCFEGVWFKSLSPTGPWEVTASVPKEIYEIPVSSPAHNVTYVTVEDEDDEWVTFAAAAAYTGVMVAWGCAVWGTGWYYPPYYYGGYYRPYYPTYGYGAWYNPWTGAYGRGYAAYGPYGGAGYAARYNPRTGTYARGAVAWGPYGSRGVASAYNPRTGTAAHTRQGSNVYGSWGSTAVTRGDQWATTSRVTNNRTGTTTRVTQGSGGGEMISRNTRQGGSFVGQTGGGDIYAGRDGNVYRNTGDGWQKFEGGSWNNVPSAGNLPSGVGGREGTPKAGDRSGLGSSSSSTINQLNKDRSARSSGAQRTSDLGSVRSGSVSSSRSGSYRPSGGMRGGGGRRR